MKFKTELTILSILILLAGNPALAQDAASEQEQRQAELRQAYEEALSKAEVERQAALESVERAREQAAQARSESVRAREAEAQAREAELAAMREELSRAHDQLRSASREVARVHREINRDRFELADVEAFINLGDRAVIGVILGDSTSEGVEILGVSPDGPSERAGLEQGDVIVAMMDKKLADGDNDDPRAVLNEVMESVQVGDEIVIEVDRDGERLDFTVTADKREPFAWQSIVRLPSVSSAVSAVTAPMVIERIEIPEIDEEAIRLQVERLRDEVDEAGLVIKSRMHSKHLLVPDSDGWEYEFETFSDFGDEALREANIWFGLPATRGLKLAEIDPQLGQYFDSDRGILVLKAQEGNHLQLQSGDVILQVEGKEVNTPSDLMRALREWEPGASIELDIKRDRKHRTLDVVMPEKTLGFDLSSLKDKFHFKIHGSPN